MLARLRDLAERAGLLASRCPVCGALTRERDTLCPRCAEALAPRAGGYCPVCGELFGDESMEPAVCPECLHQPPPWDRLAFHSAYQGALRDLILGYKFKGRYGHTRLLAGLARHAAELHLEAPADGVVPVPLHGRRLAWRGFNQSSELGRAVGRALGVAVWDRALVRTRYTMPQTRLDRKARQTNLKDAFAADASLVRGRRILLVDDVYTTGSTLGECARTLKRAGAAAVDALVLARTTDQSA